MTGYLDDNPLNITPDFSNMPNLKTIYIPKCLVKMRVGGASNKSVNNIVQKMKEDYRAIKTHQVGGINTLLYKNLSKIGQFFAKNWHRLIDSS